MQHPFSETLPRGVLNVTIKDGPNRSLSMEPFLFKVQGVRKVLNPYVEVALAYVCYLFAGIKELYVLWISPSNGNRLALDAYFDDAKRQVIFLRLILLYGLSCNNLVGLILCDFGFLDSLNTIFTFARMSQIDFDVSSLEARNSDIVEDLCTSNFLQCASTTSCLRHISFAKFLLQFPNGLCYIEQ